MFRQWLSQWFEGLAKPYRAERRSRAKPARKSMRLFVELLEDRTVPSTFTVNELLDTHAVNLISGTDATGNISLRSAIEAADHLGGDQTIQFDPGVFAVPQTITLRHGGLPLKGTSTGDINIQGPAAGVTISGNHAGRVLMVESGTRVNVTGLTISDGTVNGNGGGIYNAGTLTLVDSTVSGNTTAGPLPAPGVGSGIYDTHLGGGIYNKGRLTIDNCTISGNIAAEGGGICNGNHGYASGTLDLDQCILSGNNATGSPSLEGVGGGISNSGKATITNTEFSGNKAAEWGGAIWDGGQLTLGDSTISGNHAGGRAGGVYLSLGTATLTDSTISGNSAGLAGGGVYAYGGTNYIDDCTVSDNSSDSGGGVACSLNGFSGSEPLTFTNSTLSGNTAAADGGGITISSGEVALRDSTISGNTADHGGGIYAQRYGNYNGASDLTLNNTIIASNTSRAADGDCVAFISSPSANNLIGDGKGIEGGIRNNVNGNQVGAHAAPINPLLAPLGNYGGPTQTMALLPGSPAIDAGSIAALPAGLTTDQRGLPRVVNGTVDIGAVESPLASLPAPTDLTPSGAVAASAGYDTPTFMWDAVAGADHYDLTVVDSNAGRTLINVPDISGTSYATTVAQALTPGHTFTTYLYAFSTDNLACGFATQSFSLAALPAPTGIIPSGAVTASAGYDQPTFNWSDPGAAYYSLKVVDNTTHTTSIVVSHITGTSYATTVAQALTPGHSYTTYVHAFSTNGKVNALSTQTFALAALAAPTGITPSGVITASAGYDQPTFSWNAVAGANHYTLLVVDNTTGTTPIIARNLSGASYGSTASQALTPGQKFTVKVYAYSTNGKSHSLGSQSFMLAPLTAPTLGQPSGTVATSPLNFTWLQVPGADHYYLSVVDDTTGATVIKNPNVVGNSFSPSVPLISGHKYTWRVAAVSANKIVAIWSTSENFTIT
jgi:hypothetical protein